VIEPADEVDALVDVLAQNVKTIVITPFAEKMEKDNKAAMLKNKAVKMLSDTLFDVILKARQQFVDGQRIAMSINESVLKEIVSDKKKFVSLFNDPVAKLLAIIKKQLGMKRPIVDDTKKNIGDLVSNWKLKDTEFGKSLFTQLTEKSAGEAVKNMTPKIGEKMQSVIKPLVEAAQKYLTFVFGTGKTPPDAITKLFPVTALEENYINKLFNQALFLAVADSVVKGTDLGGFFKVIGAMADKVSEMEKEFTESKKPEETIAKINAALWQILSQSAIELWEHIYVYQVNAMKAFVDDMHLYISPVYLFSALFKNQMQCLNGIRVLFVKNITKGLEKAKTEDAIKKAMRVAFRDALFGTIDSFVKLCWIQFYTAVLQFGKGYALQKFSKEIWPKIKTQLDSLKDIIPPDVAKLGVTVESLAFSVSNLLINTSVENITKRVFLVTECVVWQRSTLVDVKSTSAPKKGVETKKEKEKEKEKEKAKETLKKFTIRKPKETEKEKPKPKEGEPEEEGDDYEIDISEDEPLTGEKHKVCDIASLRASCNHMFHQK